MLGQSLSWPHFLLPLLFQPKRPFRFFRCSLFIPHASFPRKLCILYSARTLLVRFHHHFFSLSLQDFQGHCCLYDASLSLSLSLPEWSACSIEPAAWHLVYFRRTLFSVFIPTPISCLYFYLSLIHSAFGIRTFACLSKF